jgi:DNA modification methylase
LHKERCTLSKRKIDSFENRFIVGDCEEILKDLPSKSIDLVFTSPPYANQRNYGTEESSISPDDYMGVSF